MSEEVIVQRSDQLEKGDDSGNLLRETAFNTDNAVMMRSQIQGKNISDWHHHGEREVYGYLTEGKAVVEYGENGDKSAEINPGDFFRIPVGLVHRDVNPVDEKQGAIGVFVGSGPMVINVDSPTG